MNHKPMLPLVLLAVGLSPNGWIVPDASAQSVKKPADPPPAGEESTGVYVSESIEAMERVRQVRRLADSGLWDQAAQLIQEIEAKHGAKLLPEEEGLYISVTDYVNRELADWPAEGLAAYRRRYDRLARQAYEQAAQAHDAMRMSAVARRYWASSLGARAADEAAELSLECGRVATAIEWWRRLADHPVKGDTDGRAAILAKLAVALAWDGQADQARAVADRLAREFAGSANPFGGEERTISEWARARGLDGSGLTADLGPTSVGGDYPILGGTANRVGLADCDVEFGAQIWEFKDYSPKVNPNAPKSPPAAMSGVVQSRPRAMLIPVVANGMIFLHHPSGVYAVSASGGGRLWVTELNRTAAAAQNVYYGGYPQANEPPLFSPTYCDGRLYVNFGPGLMNVGYFGQASGGAGQQSGLVCLDAFSGRELWRLTTGQIEGMEGARIDGSPLVWGGRVFLVARKVRGGVFENCTLLAADARTGAYLWHRPITEAANFTSYYGGPVRQTPPSLVAGEGDTVYLTSNLGSVAAVAAESGAVRWLRLYWRGESFFRQVLNKFVLAQAQPNQPAPPTVNLAPTVLWNGRVVVMPPDGKEMLVLDGATGRKIAAVDRKKDLESATEVYGLADGKLFVRGGVKVLCWDLAASRRLWTVTLDKAPTYPGFITARHLYVPTSEALVRIALSAPGRAEKFRWPADADGTVLLTDRQILTINENRVAGFCEWLRAQARCQADIAARPGDPNPLLVYAEIAYATNNMDIAIEQLAKAVEVAGGFASLTDRGLKEKIFTDAVNFAGATWTKDPAATLKLLTMAANSPPHAEAHVRYRFELARYWQDQADPAQAVRYYQQVIAQPELRRTDYEPPKADAKVEAGRFARDAIDRLLAAHGPSVYLAVAAEADRAYDATLAQQNWTRLDELVHEYPNAPRTRREIVRLSEHHAGRANIDGYEAAIDRLRYLRQEYAAVLEKLPAEDVDALAAMIRYSFALADQWRRRPDSDESLARSRSLRALRQAYSLVKRGQAHPDTRIALNDVQATFAEHRQRLETLWPGLRAPLAPHLALPLAANQEIVLAGFGRMLSPAVGPRVSACDDIVLVLSNEPTGACELRAYRPAREGGRTLWSKKFEPGNNPTLACYFEDQAVMVTRGQLQAIELENGKTRTCPIKPGPNVQPPNLFARHENMLLAAAYNGPANLIDLDTCQPVADFAPADPINSLLFMNEQVICYVSRMPKAGLPAPNTARLVVLNARTGKAVRQFPQVNAQMPAMQWVAADPDGHTVLLADHQRVLAVDVASGKEVGRADRPPGGRLFSAPLGLAVRGDALYLADVINGEAHVSKYSLPRLGRPQWDRIIPPLLKGQAVTGTLRLADRDDDLVVWSENLVAAVDPESGKTFWVGAGTLKADIRVMDVLVAQDYVVASCLRVPGVKGGMGLGGVFLGAPRQTMDLCFYARAGGSGLLTQTIEVDLAQNFYGGQGAVTAANPGLLVQVGPNKIRAYLPSLPGMTRRSLPPPVKAEAVRPPAVQPD